MGQIYLSIRRRPFDGKYNVWRRVWVEREPEPNWIRHSDQEIVAVAKDFEEGALIREIALTDGKIVQPKDLKQYLQAHKKAA